MGTIYQRILREIQGIGEIKMKVRIVKKYQDLQLKRIVEKSEELRVQKERALELEKAGVAEIIQEEKNEKEPKENCDTPPESNRNLG